MFRFKAQIAEDGSREAIACYLEEPRPKGADSSTWNEKDLYLYSLANCLRLLCTFKVCNAEAGHFNPEKTIHDLFRASLSGFLKRFGYAIGPDLRRRRSLRRRAIKRASSLFRMIWRIAYISMLTTMASERLSILSPEFPPEAQMT